MYIKELDIQVRDSILDPSIKTSEPTVTVRTGSDGSAIYKVWLYLDGRDLPYIKSVTYHLHPTFPNPVVKVERTVRNPNCQLIIWTWGIFTIGATVEDKQGRLLDIQYELSYGEQLTSIPNLKYVRDVDDGTQWKRYTEFY